MKSILILMLSMVAMQIQAQTKGEVRNLYGDEEIPGAALPVGQLTDAEIPKLYDYQLASSEKDLVFLVIPGGGYSGVAINHEGHDVAARLNDQGYSAYVLSYRLPTVKTMKDKRFGPLQDAQYALATIRKENKNKKVVVIGFSAGGHLAGSLSTLYNHPQTKELKKANLRPDFSVLCYPVISMNDTITHKGSKEKLIGPEFSAKDVELFSLEKQVTKNSQPTFLMSAKDDKVVPIENTYRYQQSLNRMGIPNTLFTYEEGGHGFGLVNKTDARDWFAAMLDWLNSLPE